MNPYRYDIQTLGRKARVVRCYIVRLNANSPVGGHIKADLPQVRLLTVPCFRTLNVVPDRPDDPQCDIYVQSKGYAVGCYYCVLAEAGFLPVEWSETYQHVNSHFPGHPVWQKTPSIELNTSVPGRGLPVAVGLTPAAKKSNSTHRTLLITGDGELAKGSNWEAALAVAHYGLGNLVIINDRNSLQLAGSMREIMNTDPLTDKWRAFGMEVSECQGSDMASVVAAIEGLQQNGKSNIIIANATKGVGISSIQGRPEWHHRVPKGEEIALVLEELKDK